MYIRTLAALGLVAAVAACGADPADRALTGGAIGVGAGAAAGELVADDPWTGALAGGAIGAAAGALTDEGDVDLGEPIWEENDWF
jgi:hypothetical protein